MDIWKKTSLRCIVTNQSSDLQPQEKNPRLPGDIVWVRTHPLSHADDGFMAKISPKWRGPARVVKKLGPVVYKVSMLSDPTQIDSYHTQNLKICHVSNFDTKGRGM